MANIYFVDDDLRHRGHDVQRASSVDEALQDAERIAKSDLAVLDLIMPASAAASETPDGARSSGMLVFRELRRRRAYLPILV
jgi:CheY-like chemotaxis protein